MSSRRDIWKKSSSMEHNVAQEWTGNHTDKFYDKQDNELEKIGSMESRTELDGS